MVGARVAVRERLQASRLATSAFKAVYPATVAIHAVCILRYASPLFPHIRSCFPPETLFHRRARRVALLFALSEHAYAALLFHKVSRSSGCGDSTLSFKRFYF